MQTCVLTGAAPSFKNVSQTFQARWLHHGLLFYLCGARSMLFISTGAFFVRRSNKDVNCSLGDGLILEPVMIIVHGGDCGLVVLPPETINKVVLPSVLEQKLSKLRVLQDYCFPKYSPFVQRSRKSSGRMKQWNPAQKRFSVGNPLIKADWRGNAAIVLNR